MKTYSSLILILLVSVCYGQNIYVVGEGNFSTFQMNDLKNFQQAFIKQSGLPMQSVDQFPSYYGFGVQAAVDIRQYSLGIQGGFTSTGSRADYEDYSGIARLDQLARCYWIGPYFQMRLSAKSSWKPFLSFRSSYVYTDLKEKTLLEVGSVSQHGEDSFHSANIALRPELGVRKDVRNIFIQASFGYEFQFHGKLYLNSNSSAYLQNGSGKEAYAEWDGLRASLGVGIFIKKREHSDSK